MSNNRAEQLAAMRKFFNSGATLSYAFRKKQLQILKAAILKHQDDLHHALYEDLKKSAEECWVTETGFVISEINAALKNLRLWMQPEKVKTNLLNFPSKSFVMKEPWGLVLIIGPWNYPLQLLLNPLVGAIAAGNCVVLKSSEFAVAATTVMKKIIKENFSPEYILFTDGDGAKVVPALMNSTRFDYIFYTGSTTVGKIIYKAAAEQLTPVTIELGGKSPAVVEADANIKIAAKRIALTKFSNAGQMCVAPDYVLVNEKVKDEFVREIKKALVDFFDEDPLRSYNYGKIINEKQFDRICGYLQEGKIIFGGQTDRSHLYIQPTLMEEVSMKSKLMEDEIFGPVLPILSYQTFEQAKEIIDKNPHPLAFYVFTGSSKKEKMWLQSVQFGGGCVNNASWHLTNHHLPFGGRGNSGIGNYHGRASFETFSHKKSIMKTPTWFDPAIKYPPFKGKLWLFKKIIK
ncbi:MAG: aldehyde dehydrogenase family protein [Chitinophagaceae bacterium]